MYCSYDITRIYYIKIIIIIIIIVIYNVLYYNILYHNILYHTIPYHIIPYHTILYYYSRASPAVLIRRSGPRAMGEAEPRSACGGSIFV